MKNQIQFFWRKWFLVEREFEFITEISVDECIWRLEIASESYRKFSGKVHKYSDKLHTFEFLSDESLVVARGEIVSTNEGVTRLRGSTILNNKSWLLVPFIITGIILSLLWLVFSDLLRGVTLLELMMFLLFASFLVAPYTLVIAPHRLREEMLHSIEQSLVVSDDQTNSSEMYVKL